MEKNYTDLKYIYIWKNLTDIHETVYLKHMRQDSVGEFLQGGTMVKIINYYMMK